MYNSLYQLLLKYDRIIIHRHSSPDGDALGSQVGFKHIILDNFPEKEVYAVGDKAGRYAFMDDTVMDEIPDELYHGALAVILDTSSPALISDSRYTLAEKTARIDHHLFCGKIADVELIDSSYESCCGLIASFAQTFSLSLSPLAAKSLFTGMVTDSGRFRYDSTSSKTFALASYLMQQPFDTNEIYKNLYANDFEQMKLRALFTMRIQFTEKNVAYIYTSKDDLKEINADIFTVSRGMVSTMSDIRGVDIWANFTETDSGVLCELRSSRYNINPIAVKYGGGGHAKASGATLADRRTAMAMLRDLDRLTEGD